MSDNLDQYSMLRLEMSCLKSESIFEHVSHCSSSAWLPGDRLSLTDEIVAAIDERRQKAPVQTEIEIPEVSEKKKAAYIDLIMQLDQFEDERERRFAQDRTEGIDWPYSVLPF